MKKDPIASLRGKKIAVLGLSVEGFSTAEFLLKNGLAVTVLDRRNSGRLRAKIRALESRGPVARGLGEKYLENIEEFKVVFRTPGFPLFHPRLVEAKGRGVEISSQTKLFFDLCPCPIVGVTGTKGKGTTATLIFRMLKAGGFDAFLGGNIGRPPLEFVTRLKPASWVVLELSSFQLEDLEKSPRVAVVLMTTAEHLAPLAAGSPNFHHGVAAYRRAKRNIVLHQRKDDAAVLNYDFRFSRSLAAETAAKVYYFSRSRSLNRGAFIEGRKIYFRDGKKEFICGTDDIFLRGRHNWENVSAAVTAAKIVGVEKAKLREAIRSFKGLEHRLEFVAAIGGVSYYNDSFSTAPEAAVAALKSFSEPLIVILGGSEKGSDYARLGEELAGAANLRVVILIGETAPRIKKAMLAAGGFGGKIVEGCKTMGEIVAAADRYGESGGTVVLSPACASFDMFKDYKDRGRQFRAAVKELKRRKEL